MKKNNRVIKESPAERLIRETHRRLQDLSIEVLHDFFHKDKEFLDKYLMNLDGTMILYNEGKVSSVEMKVYCINHGLEVYDFVRGIPNKHKRKIAGFDMVTFMQLCRKYPKAAKYLDASVIAFFLTSIVVLSEVMKFSDEDIQKFAYEVKNLIDSWYEDYLSDEIMNDYWEIIKEECEFDRFAVCEIEEVQDGT